MGTRLLVSNPDWGGLLDRIEYCIELGGRYVIAVRVEPLVVEPVHLRQRLQLEFVEVVSAARRRRARRPAECLSGQIETPDRVLGPDGPVWK